MTTQQTFALALQHHRAGRLTDADALYRQILAVQPHHAEARHHLGIVAHQSGRPELAVEWIRQALVITPNHPIAHSNLGEAYRSAGRLDEAIASFRCALELMPDQPGMYNNLGLALAGLGQLDEALAAYRRALALQPDYAAVQSSIIYTLHLHPGQDERMIAGEHQRWNRQFSEPLKRFILPLANVPDPQRRLKIGYVSPDFCFHAISFFLAPLLEARDHGPCEIYCYASVQRPDAMTERLRKSADEWRDVRALSDAELAERVRHDGIDILVDLAMHTANNRLPAFARKPAPIQVAWLGYPGSTGLPAMDYRFTDALLEPEGSPSSASAETPVRLPGSWCCFEPIDEYPEPGALPALRAGHVTFGSLNNFCKVNEAVLRVWVAVLRAVEGSRLLLRCPAGTTQTRLRQWFETQGIAAHRLDLLPRIATRAEFRQLFQRIDVALDPFPYNGATTTCEALWMGIPVVSLAGRTAVSRAGLSLLTNVGLPEWVASSEDDYIRIATQQAQDLPRLAELRATLRPRMQASPLMDAPRFARNIETAYRTMRQAWCTKQS